MPKNSRSNLESNSGQELKVVKDGLKDTELALVAELIKNSRRSDRELARALKVSQPTVSRLIRKLEREKVINEYTMIPDFRKVGYNLCAFIFLNMRQLSPEERQKAIEAVKERLTTSTACIMLLERGIGLGYQAVMINLYRDYASYAEHRNIIRQFPFITPSEVESFLIDLNDEVHYRYLTFSCIAKDMLRSKNKT